MADPTPEEVQQMDEESAWQAWLLRFNHAVQEGIEAARVVAVSDPGRAAQMTPRAVMQTVILQRLFRLERDFREMVNALAEMETGERMPPPTDEAM